MAPDAILASLGTRHTPRGGYRTPEMNRAVGGARRSWHMQNMARDVPLQGNSRASLRRAFEGAGYEVLELLGPGDRGHDDHYHIAYRPRGAR